MEVTRKKVINHANRSLNSTLMIAIYAQLITECQRRMALFHKAGTVVISYQVLYESHTMKCGLGLELSTKEEDHQWLQPQRENTGRNWAES